VQAPENRKTGEIFREFEPEDLLKYGLIPEFVRRSAAVCPRISVRVACVRQKHFVRDGSESQGSR
jgi:ATP-dependent protease Clp ATPase subunit